MTDVAPLKVLVACDKFRGTASARQVSDAIAEGARRVGAVARAVPLADGGEGTVEMLGGANRVSEVPDALGAPARAPWRLHGGRAIIELAAASGLEVVGGAAANDPLAATSDGTAMLIREAIELGARQVVVGAGGSAATDGGLGATRLLGDLPRHAVQRIRLACDVDIGFVDAATSFGPQKGADVEQVAQLVCRLDGIADDYLERYGVDVRSLPRTGSAGGFAGGLAVLGAELLGGFDLVASTVGLHGLIADSDVVITGEGRLDEQSFLGKVVGGVVQLGARNSVPTIVLAGDVRGPVPPELGTVRSLVDEFGLDAAMASTTECLAELAQRCIADVLTARKAAARHVVAVGYGAAEGAATELKTASAEEGKVHVDGTRVATRTTEREAAAAAPHPLAWEKVTQTFGATEESGFAVHELDLHVAAGEFLTIVGPSGCGKSTLLNMAAGLLAPTSGRVLFHGSEITRVNTELGYITQDDHLLPWRTLLQNVQLPLEIRHVPRDERKERAMEFIKLAGLEGYENHRPNQLSGGMRKRAALIRTLVYEPNVIVMDEPFGALDAQLRTRMHQELLRLWETQRQTIVFITHDIYEAVALSDRIVVMSRRPGRIVMDVEVPIDRPRNVFDLAVDPVAVQLHGELWAALGHRADGRP